MSATSETLFEKIRKTETLLAEATSAGDQATVQKLTEDLKALQKQFAAAADALTEGKQILKG